MKLTVKSQSGSNQEHAILSPSGSKKWLGCAASLICEADIPNESGAAAVNGTAMHSMSEDALNRILGGWKGDAGKYKGSYVLNEGKGPIQAAAKPPKGSVLVTDDFVQQVNRYLDYCRPVIDAAEVFEVEYRVNLSRVLHKGVKVTVRDQHGGPLIDEATGKPKMVLLKTFGTADLVALIKLTDGTYQLIVGDLKTGRHKVLAKENKQMMLYALGILRAMESLYDISSVRLVIFQPYSGGEDEWDTTPEALEQFGKYASTRARAAIDAYERGKAKLTTADFRPSPDACQWCRFADKCSAKSKAAIVSPGQASDDDLSDEATTANGEMTLVQLKAEWDKLPLLRQHIADIEKAVYSALHRGDKVPGLKLVEGKPGNRTYELPEAEIAEIMEEGGVPDDVRWVETKKVLSPAAAEKALKTAYPRVWRKLDKVISRPKAGQPSVASADDKRPEWQAASDEDLS